MLSASFESVVGSVVGSSLRIEGFERSSSSNVRVTFRRQEIALSFAYLPEELPRSWVSVEIGLIDSHGHSSLCGLWRGLPDEVVQKYSSWRFGDDQELREVLERIERCVLRPYGWEILRDRAHVANLLAVESKAIDARIEEDQRQLNLRRGRKAFDDGDFATVLAVLGVLGEEYLNAGDRRRLHLARRALRQT